MKKGNLFIISGPSAGVGKATLIDGAICDKSLNLIQCQTCTSRKPRGQRSDEQYIFLTASKFEKAIANREFLEYNFLDGNYYGTHRQILENALSSGKNVILEIEYHGAMRIKKLIPSAKTIFIFAPLGDIEKRIRKRAENTEEQIQKRLEIAREELRYKDYYDYQVENIEGKPETGIKKLKELVKANI